MRVLDIFCGLKSVTRVLEAEGYTVDTLDIEAKFEPTFGRCVLDFDYKSSSEIRPEARAFCLAL